MRAAMRATAASRSQVMAYRVGDVAVLGFKVPVREPVPHTWASPHAEMVLIASPISISRTRTAAKVKPSDRSPRAM